jgi:hypothetical protein
MDWLNTHGALASWVALVLRVVEILRAILKQKKKDEFVIANV